MALIKCTECEREISDKAKICPGCGHKLYKKNIESSVKKVSAKIGSVGKKLLFVVSVLVITFFMIIALILLYNQITGIGKLNYPLTAILPTISCLISIVFLIILFISMNKWRKKEKSKKYFKISFILLITSIICFSICSPINLAIRKHEIGYRNQGSSTYHVKGISYEIPNKWKTEPATDGYYHYPYIENSDGLLYVAGQYSTSFNETMCKNIEDCYDDFIDGIKSGLDDSYFKMISKEKIQIMNKEAVKLKYKAIINEDNFMETETYIFLDLKDNTIYTFMFSISEEIPDDIYENINIIISSIKER